jgi:hypothetical protein
MQRITPCLWFNDSAETAVRSTIYGGSSARADRPVRLEFA